LLFGLLGGSRDFLDELARRARNQGVEIMGDDARGDVL